MRQNVNNDFSKDSSIGCRTWSELSLRSVFKYARAFVWNGFTTYLSTQTLSLRISFEFTVPLYCRASLDVFLFIENCVNVEEIYLDGKICHYALLSSASRRSFEVKSTTQSSKAFQAMIFAGGNAILAIAFRSLKKSGLQWGFEPVISQSRCNWLVSSCEATDNAMCSFVAPNAPMTNESMDKMMIWNESYLKLRIWNQVNLWSSQLGTQF